MSTGEPQCDKDGKEADKTLLDTSRACRFFGVFSFTLFGTMSTVVYFLGEATEMELASFFQIGLAYALGITFAIVVGAMSSGGHFHPAITLCQVVFKGFPAKKAPFYIFAQLRGYRAAFLYPYPQRGI